MKRVFYSFLSTMLVTGLAACGGGSSGSASNSLSGLAATGAAISFGAIKAKCTTGPEITGTTNVDGVFDLPLTTTHTPPCMLQVTGGTPTVTLHGFAAQAGLVNVSPITDLVVTNALGNSDPSSAYNSFDATKGSTISGNLSGAKNYVKAQVTAITGSTTTADPMSGSFKVGDADDKILDALGTALKNASKTVADLRPGASTSDALTKTVPPLSTPNGTGGTETTTGGGTTGNTGGTTGAYVTRTNPTGWANAPAQVVWTGSQFVALEQSIDYHNPNAKFATWVSSDGIAWTRNVTNMQSDYPGLSTANGLLFQLGSGALFGPTSTVSISPDAINWTASTFNFTMGAYSTTPLGVNLVNSKYFLSLDVDACMAITSGDGSSWASVDLKALPLPAGYSKDLNTKFCSQPFYIGGKYLIYGGVLTVFGKNPSKLPNLGLVYTSTDGVLWTASSFALPVGITNLQQGGRVNLAMQIGSNIVLPASTGKVLTSADGLNFTLSDQAGFAAADASGIVSYYPSLALPGGTLANTLLVGPAPTYNYIIDYYLTTDGINFLATSDFGLRSTSSGVSFSTIQAYSPTLRRLVVIKSVLSTNTNVPTIMTYDFPALN